MCRRQLQGTGQSSCGRRQPATAPSRTPSTPVARCRTPTPVTEASATQFESAQTTEERVQRWRSLGPERWTVGDPASQRRGDPTSQRQHIREGRRRGGLAFASWSPVLPPSPAVSLPSRLSAALPPSLLSPLSRVALSLSSQSLLYWYLQQQPSLCLRVSSLSCSRLSRWSPLYHSLQPPSLCLLVSPLASLVGRLSSSPSPAVSLSLCAPTGGRGGRRAGGLRTDHGRAAHADATNESHEHTSSQRACRGGGECGNG